MLLRGKKIMVELPPPTVTFVLHAVQLQEDSSTPCFLMLFTCLMSSWACTLANKNKVLFDMQLKYGLLFNGHAFIVDSK